MKWFQKWGIQTDVEFFEGPSKSTIVCTNANDQGPAWIFQRFKNDIRSFALIILTLLIAYPIWGVSPNLAQFSFARPFVWGPKVTYIVPNEMPKNCLVCNHHWYHHQMDFQGMFAIGQLQRHFRVFQRMTSDQVTSRVYGAIYMYRHSSDANWTLAKEYKKQSQTNAKHSLCMTVFPDRESMTQDTDPLIAQAHGLFALSLAAQCPILDCRLYAPMDDPSRSIVFEYFVLEMPKCDPLHDWTLAGQSQWRSQHKNVIAEQACNAKKQFIEWKEKSYSRPMCPAWPAKTYNRKKFSNENMVDRYKCDQDPDPEAQQF